MKKVKKTVVLGVTGGIAAFKVLELISILRKAKLATVVIMTKSAAQMISPEEFEKATGNKVYTALFEKDFDYKNILKSRTVDHIAVADLADIFVVIPATANSIGKIAHGIADDFLTTCLLATKAPILICPSMNVNMWKNPIVQKNVSQLHELGFYLFMPGSGKLACGYEGEGRLPNIQTIYEEIMELLQKGNSLANKTIIVTAGGTKEKIDDVRVITNKSSGKMGIAIAESCFLRGAKVILLRAENSVSPRYPMHQELFETVEQLEKLLTKYVPTTDICYHAAAVSDFFVKAKKGKITSDHSLSLELIPREKLYKKIKQLHPHILLFTFKAEWGRNDKDILKIARNKLASSEIDGIITNDVSKQNQGFEVDTNAVIIVLKNGLSKKFGLKTKKILADEIVEYTGIS